MAPSRLKFITGQTKKTVSTILENILALITGPIDGELLPNLDISARGSKNNRWIPVGPKPSDLSIEVGEVTPLQERIIGESNTGDNMRSAEGHLFDFGEEFCFVG